MNKGYGLLIRKNMEEVYLGLDISQTETLRYIYHMGGLRRFWVLSFRSERLEQVFHVALLFKRQ